MVASNKPPVPSRRFSRQNTIQVVSDVQGVLTDILLDIVPYPPPPHQSSHSSNPRSALQHANTSTADYGEEFMLT